MLDYADNGAYVNKLDPEIQQAKHKTVTYIHEHGAARSADFKDATKKGGTWWNRSPEKQALEHQFNAGILMIPRRSGFQRIYDLRERIHSTWDDGNTYSREEGMRLLVQKSVKALGVAPARWLSPYYPSFLRTRTAKREITPLLNKLTQAGVLTEVAVSGWQEPAYIHQDNLDLAGQAVNHALHSIVTTFLSPSTWLSLTGDAPKSCSVFATASKPISRLSSAVTAIFHCPSFIMSP